jgi:hypothetical protein
MASLTDLSAVEILDKNPLTEQLLTPECLRLIVLLQRLYNPIRKQLLKAREEKALQFDNGLPMVKQTLKFYLILCVCVFF